MYAAYIISGFRSDLYGIRSADYLTVGNGYAVHSGIVAEPYCIFYDYAVICRGDKAVINAYIT